MNHSTRHAIRTGLQVTLAVLAALAILVPVIGLPAVLGAKIGATIAGLAIAISKIQNAAEDAGLIPGIVKSPSNPVPDGVATALSDLTDRLNALETVTPTYEPVKLTADPVALAPVELAPVAPSPVMPDSDPTLSDLAARLASVEAKTAQL